MAESLDQLRSRAERWHRVAARFQADPAHYELGFFSAREWHRQIKADFGFSIYR